MDRTPYLSDPHNVSNAMYGTRHGTLHRHARDTMQAQTRSCLKSSKVNKIWPPNAGGFNAQHTHPSVQTNTLQDSKSHASAHHDLSAHRWALRIIHQDSPPRHAKVSTQAATTAPTSHGLTTAAPPSQARVCHRAHVLCYCSCNLTLPGLG
jgi:hypothetical protein